MFWLHAVIENYCRIPILQIILVSDEDHGPPWHPIRLESTTGCGSKLASVMLRYYHPRTLAFLIKVERNTGCPF